VGLPHRNYSVFKQIHINYWEVKMVEVRTRASEAKGPFPGGKRVGSWGKKKETKAKEKVLIIKTKSPSTKVNGLE